MISKRLFASTTAALMSVAPAADTSAKSSQNPALSAVEKANRTARHEPTTAFFINAAQVLPWRDGALYKVYTAPGAVTDIALQPGETLIAVAAGDTARWIIGDTTSGAADTKRSHILVKPMTPGLATNLVITTDRRVYRIDLSSTRSTAMASLAWTYPEEALLAVRAPASARLIAASKPTMAIEQLNFGYEISGDRPPWRPIRAFDDGQHSFIEFPASIASGEAPPLFVLGDDGTPELVNYRMQGRFYRIDRLFDRAELRIGIKRRQVVHIQRVQSAGSTGKPRP